MNILGKGKRPVSVSYFTSPDVTIELDASTATSRLNSDGNYYTITFPDDFIGTRGTADDAFKSVRIGTGPISSPASALRKLNVIINIPAGMRIGANTANNIIPPQFVSIYGYYHKTDPALYFKFNTSDWTPDILNRLNVTVNNHGVLFGGGGSGGWGGMTPISGKTTSYPGRGGAGSGAGVHPAHGTNTLGDYYDPLDTTFPAGQAGSGYGWWLGTTNKAANGTHGTANTRGVGGAGVSDAASAHAALAPGIGHYGGSVIYYTSDVASPTTGTHITLYNKGWMSAGCGGASGTSALSGAAAYGGSWYHVPYALEHLRGAGQPGLHGGLATPGGLPGQLFEKAVGTQLSISNTVTNVSANNIYGLDEKWPPE